jgi:hypothetical protein
VVVELDVFSGRPNPRWELRDPDAEQLRGRIGRLKGVVDGAAQPPGLGYRGFRCADAVVSYIVYGGYVRVGNSVLADPGRLVERWLLDRMPPEFDSLRPVVVAELDRQ